MNGFFTRKEVESKSRPTGKVLSCAACGLYRDCNSARMEPYGEFKKGILVIGEAPGEYEDRVGKPWQGKAGVLLQSTLKEMGISLFEDCLSINACRCRPMDEKGNNRTPLPKEIESCRRENLRIIQERKPKLIIALGNSALFSLIGHRWKKDFDSINKWRGFRIPDQDFHSWICPTFHPSFIEREQAQEVETIWKHDLSQALELLKVNFPVHKEPEIEIITDLRPLYQIHDQFSAFDYETTGKKPHAAGHRIVSASVTRTPDHVYAFLMPMTREERQPFLSYLSNPSVLKIAQNMKFEDHWSNVRLQTPVVQWYWDTMLVSHMLDNRTGVTGLKFQVYVNFGIVDYDSEIEPYLKSTNEKSDNAMNRILELISTAEGQKKLLTYNGYDSIYEHRLSEIQRSIVEPLPF